MLQQTGNELIILTLLAIAVLSTGMFMAYFLIRRTQYFLHWAV